MSGPMNIQELLEKNIPIWVINRSATVLGKPHRLMLEFPHPTGGKKSSVDLPPIPYPINLSARVAPPSAIGLSQDFVDLLNNGVLEIVSPERAAESLRDPEARAAVKHAFDKLSNRRRGSGLRATPGNFKVHTGGRQTTATADLGGDGNMGLTAKDFYHNVPGGHDDDETEAAVKQHIAQMQVTAESSTVTPRIVTFCLDLVNNPELKKDYLMDLKTMDPDSLSDEDLGYMVEQLKSFDTIVSHVKLIMAKRAGQDDDQEEASPKQQGRRGRKPKGKHPMEEALDDEV